MITRRQWLGGLASAVPALSAAPKRIFPNVVVIFADDLGYGDLGCYGHPTIRTPNLDRMAAEGIRFTQFYSASSVCSPSRAALLTGRLPVRSGVNQVLSPWSHGGLPAEEITIAEPLQELGYATACVGKWHLGVMPHHTPARHGFTRYFGIPYSNDMSRATAGNPGFIRQLEKHPEVGGTPLLRGDQIIELEPDQTQLTTRYTEESIEFIRDSAESRQPFFLYLPHSMPHHPLAASPRFRGKSPRGLYGDVIEELDWSVGEIRRTLKELKIDRNTLVVFASDNGPWLVKNEDGGSAGLLREGKATFWEGGFRVPGIFAWPTRLPAGVVSTTPASTLDLVPTVWSMVGLQTPPGLVLDGQDITPVLAKAADRPDFTHFYYMGPKLAALRRGPWKLVLQDPPQLYQLNEDPSERYDRAAAQPNVVSQLTRIADEHRASFVPGAPQT